MTAWRKHLNTVVILSDRKTAIFSILWQLLSLSVKLVLGGGVAEATVACSKDWRICRRNLDRCSWD